MNSQRPRWVFAVSMALVFSLSSADFASAKARSLRIPLQEGRLHTDDLTGDLRSRIGLGKAAWLNGRIDFRGVRGAVAVRALNAALGAGCSITLSDDDSALLIRFDAEQLPRGVDETKTAVRTFTEVSAPVATTRQREFYGLHLPYESKFITDGSAPLVILIHGLDCNRSNWRPMAEMLDKEGFQVAYFAYPSDQALADSAVALGEQVEALRKVFPEVPIHLVAHSMGSLVSRAFVEGPEYPSIGGVETLILLAPPNHGSDWAPFRGALEVQEHYKLWRDEPRWSPTWAITDGLGEAGRDLREGSAFLQHLNSRPRREGIRYTIITGDKHPMLAFTANAADCAASLVPERARDRWGVRQCVNWLQATAADLREAKCSSDGPVDIGSAKLDGVNDFVVVPSDHTTLYIPTQPGNRPPAWEIVVDRLRG